MVEIELVDRPAAGRIFTRDRRVRLGDVTTEGRVRVDALARYLQDIARDDSADSGLENPMGWVVRRTALRVTRWPRFQEAVTLATWCSGIGPRWAERRTSLCGEHGGAVEAVTLWVHVDTATGRPARLVEGFLGLYGEAAQGRAADAKLLVPAEVPPVAHRRPWPLRRSDFDVLQHVNNAAYWEALEELLGDDGAIDGPLTAVVEHRQAVAPGEEVELCSTVDVVGRGWWVVTDQLVAAAGWCSRG